MLFQKQLEGDKLAIDEITQKYKSDFLPHYTKLLQTINVEDRINYALASNNVDRILFALTHPVSIWNKSWFYYLGSWTNKFLEPSFNPEQLDLIVANKLTQDSYIRENRVKDFNALVPVQYNYTYSFGEWKIWVNMGKQQIIHLANNASFEHIDKAQWQFYWSLFNVFQSSDVAVLNNEQTENKSSAEWKSEVLEMYDSYLHPLIDQAIAKGFINQTNSDYLDSWLDDDGNVLADADFILPSLKIVINPSSQESEKILQKAGFTIYNPEEINTIKL